MHVMKKNKTLGDFIKYFAGDLFVKGFMFISLPLLSRIMDPDDYGKMSLINAAVMILYVFISLNLQNAVANRYMKDTEDFAEYLGSTLIGLSVIQFCFVILSPLYGPFISQLLSISLMDFYWVIAICVLLSYIYIYTSYLQGARLSTEFVKFNVVSKLSEVVLIFIFASMMLSDKYLSKIYAQIIISAILLCYVMYKFKKITTLKFKLEYLRNALLFSAPLIIHVLSNSLLSQADRLIIAKLIGESAAGIYSFAYNLGMCVIVVIMAWNSSWQPKLYKLLNEGEHGGIKSAIYASTICIAVVSCIAILFSREMVTLFASEKYYEGISVIPIIITGNALIHIYLSYANFNFYRNRTIFISIGTLLAMLINVCLNYYLVPIYGIAGAAWATVIAYFCLALFQCIISRFSGNNFVGVRMLLLFSFFLISINLVSSKINDLSLFQSIVLKLSITGLLVTLCVKTKLVSKIRL